MLQNLCGVDQMSILRKGLKNTLILTISTGANQVLAFISFLIIPKEIGPNNYGLLSIAFTLLSFFDILASSGLNKVVIRRGCENLNNIEEAFYDTLGLKSILLVLTIVVSSLISILYYKDSNLFFLILIMGVEFSVTAIFRYIGSYYIIKEDFIPISIISIISKFIYYISLIVLIRQYPSPYLIAILLLFTSLLGLIFTILHLFNKLDFVLILKKTNLILNKHLILESLSFSGIVFMSSIHTKIDILMLSIFANNSIVGIYSLPQKLIEQLLVVSGILSISFFPILLKNKETLNRKSVFKKFFTFSIIGLVSYVAIVNLMSNSIKEIFLNHYGTDYKESPIILIILMYYLGFSFFLMPFSLFLQSNRKENVILSVYIIMVVVKVILNIILFPYYSMLGFAVTTLIIFIFGSFSLSLYSYRYVKSSQ